MSPPARECLDPKIDIAFKALFGREQTRDLLRSLLNALLAPEAPIVDIEFLNPFLEGEDVDEKVAILDLRVRDLAGKRYAIEMQIRGQPAFTERILYYASRLLALQLAPGDAYGRLEPVIVIVIADHVLLLASGLTSERTSAVTGLPLEQVERLGPQI